MNIALLIGKHNSGSVPGKNYMEMLGRPLVEYPLMAAANSKVIDKIYVSTDSPIIKEIASGYNCEIIDRPDELSRAESPTEFGFEHAYQIIKKEVPDLKNMALLFANSIDVLADYLDSGFAQLESDRSLDSVISVCKYNMFTPLRARKVNPDGTTTPILDLPNLGIDNTFDRDAMGDVYFADFAVLEIAPQNPKNLQNLRSHDL